MTPFRPGRAGLGPRVGMYLGLATARAPDDEHRVPDLQQFLHLHHLQHEAFLRLQLELHDALLNGLGKACGKGAPGPPCRAREPPAQWRDQKGTAALPVGMFTCSAVGATENPVRGMGLPKASSPSSPDPPALQEGLERQPVASGRSSGQREPCMCGHCPLADVTTTPVWYLPLRQVPTQRVAETGILGGKEAGVWLPGPP